MKGRPSIFLSSCFEDPIGTKLEIRESIRGLTGGMRESDSASRPIWMAEDFPELRPEAPLLPLEKAEFCLEGVRSSECLVAVITRRHGSPIAIGETGLVPSSFFELELFEAALLRKPAFVFLHEGYEPEGRLAWLLRVLQPSFPGMNLTPMSQDKILKQIERLLKHYQRPEWLRLLLPTPRVSTMVDTLFHLRHRPYKIREEPPPLRFVEGLFDPTLGAPDHDLVRGVLERARTVGQHQTRLTLLWLAIRVLMGTPFTAPRFRDYVPLWEDALGAWASAGAWYGLHAHAAMGCLAALGSLAEVRAVVATSSDRSHGIPHGPIASAYYSIGKLSSRSRNILYLSLEHINAALELGSNPANGLAIRGSIYLQMGHKNEALADYGEVVSLRKERGGTQYGEGLSELGYAMLLSGRWRDGLEKMEKGVDLLRCEPASGFTIRAMHKLALGYACKFNLSRALDVAVEAHDMAVTLGARDQIRSFERLAKRLHEARFWLR